MFCVKCGSINSAGATFCGSCGDRLDTANGLTIEQKQTGAPVQASVPVSRPNLQEPTRPQTSGLAIAGFVTSFFIGILGLILSILAKKEIGRSNGQMTGDGLATAGIVISCISMGLWVVLAMQ